MVHADAVVEIMRQGGIKMLAGADGLEIDNVARAVVSQLIQKLADRFQVTFPQRPRITGQIAHVFHAEKLRRSAVIEIELFVVHHVQNQHVVSPVPQQPQPGRSGSCRSAV